MFGFGRKKKAVSFEQIEIKSLNLGDTVRESRHTATVISINSAIAYPGEVKVKLSDNHEFVAQPYETIYRQTA
jgi:hypothetical protein